MSGRNLIKLRLDLRAHRHHAMAPGMEAATGGRIEWRRNITREQYPFLAVGTQAGYSR